MWRFLLCLAVLASSSRDRNISKAEIHTRGAIDMDLQSLLQTTKNMGLPREHVRLIDSDSFAQELEQPIPNKTTKVTKVKSDSSTEIRSPTLDSKTCIQAVILEPRKFKALLRVTLNALAQDEIDIVTLAHGDLNSAYVQSMDDSNLTLSQAKQKGRLTLMPLHVTDLGGDSLLQLSTTDAMQYHDLYSKVLKSHSFWDRLACDRVVTMQSDTLFCKGSKARIADFSEWGYIGGRTPTIPSSGGRMHMNGGFSFRKRPDILACLDSPNVTDNAQEDIFYSTCPLLMQPSANVSDRFAVDNALILPTEVPLAVHKPWGAGPYQKETKDICEGARELEKEQHVQISA